ncbi:MAG: hypothetical protein QM605_04485 [Sphingobium sp.]
MRLILSELEADMGEATFLRELARILGAPVSGTGVQRNRIHALRQHGLSFKRIHGGRTKVCGDSVQGEASRSPAPAKMVDFENRRAATIWVVSTGSAESRYLQPAMD